MKKSILISVYNMEIGGIERSLINMLESIDYSSYTVDLLIFNHTGDFMNLIPCQVNILPQNNKYTVFRKSIIQCLKEGHFLSALIRVLSKYIAIFKGISRKLEEGSGYIQMQLTMKYLTYILPKQSKKYDLSVSYAWPHNILAEKVEAKKKVAWIHTDYSKLEIDNKLDFLIWDKFDYIASISDECTKSFVEKYPTLKSKVVLIENITSPNFIRKMANDTVSLPKENENFFNILSVGRLSYVKGYDLAIHALRRLHDKGLTNIKWYVIGYGGYEKELQELIEHNDLNESFILLGKKTNPYPYMKACDLYVQPSRYEGKAVTVTEAKILGKPIIITNYPTAKSQLKDGNEGIICDLSVEGIAAAIERIMKNQELSLRLVNNIKEFDYSNVDELKKLYKIIG
ncbi:glycosyltransferase [Litchfieldia salsa]|uniref:Glycosyltransferase involved in cell wall bisynthesis n=1 Tax=Litchfieldia salsa TaxID=930152 RepID=A0A1H0VEN7_9BACI|nr:glycosyltransferase [Litchfieldia salsa]SDP76824.1 Glycosyltransferase involved in cell wall bisynthesis [Litchfieldia salsa]